MNAKLFLEKLISKLDTLNPNSKVGKYLYKGKNTTDAFGSPGGRWEPDEFPAFEFEKDNKIYLIRPVPEYNKLVIEAIHLSNMLINYLLNDNNYKNDSGKIELLENYKMTVVHGRSFDEVKRAMVSAGMTDNKILELDSKNIDLGIFVDSVLTWAEFREKAKEIIRNTIPSESKTHPRKEETQISTDLKKTLNQILYGPPGTGKTYNTINKALEIIGVRPDDKSRIALKKLFEIKMKEGQIVFTTFHQSMSYEDFIEGIKPTEPKQEGQPIVYKVEDGIFKQACAVAAHKCYKLFNNSKTQKTKYSFDDLYNAFIDSIKELINTDKSPIYKSLMGRDVEVKEINNNDSIIARAKNSIARKSAPLTKENLQKLYDKYKSIDEIEDLKQVKETVQVTTRITEFYAVYSGLKDFEKNYKPDEQLMIEADQEDALDFDEIQKKFNAGVYNEAIKYFGQKAEPVVIIIDEINRGNISQIFGELITLIEDDKRLGKEEALEVILPYSKEVFGVPPNLYIIGTMNTADRSVEALDAALRRRFSFEEISPKPELISPNMLLQNLWIKYSHLDWSSSEWALIENDFFNLYNGNIINREKYVEFGESVLIPNQNLSLESAITFNGLNLEKLLIKINNRIEKLLDKDHQIGHSYFMKVFNIENLKWVFSNNIIPLLQEYFFGDYGKIGLVLGKGFIRKKEWNKKDDSFANFEMDNSGDYDDKDVYEIIDYTNPTLEYFIIVTKEKTEKKIKLTFENAIQLLMNQDIE